MTEVAARAARARFTLAEHLFYRLWCKPAPAVPFEPRDTYDTSNPPPVPAEPLCDLRRVFGARFEDAIKDRVLLDIGCGPGHQVIGAAKAGASLAVGIDRDPVAVQSAKTLARLNYVSGLTRFERDSTIMGTAWADAALSRNSFEHFADPAGILRQAYDALKPGGQFFITFGPSWYHPYGVHHMFMIRLPWAHVIFSERTILRVRQLYRPNAPTTWEGVALNQMTIAKLESLVQASNFEISHFRLTPIGPLPQWLVNLKLFREWTCADVSVILTKR